MAQASKAMEAKRRILLALQRHPHGLRYMALFQRVKQHIGSLSTFQKYLEEMERQDHSVRKESDRDDSRATIFVANPESLQSQLAFLDAYNQIKRLMEHPSFPIPHQEWERYLATAMRGKSRLDAKEYEELWKHPYLLQKGKVDELVKISHELFFKMGRPPQYDATHYEGAYISVHGDQITILSKLLHDNLVDCDAMLRKILAEGKKDPDKEMWLKQCGAYELYVTYRSSNGTGRVRHTP